MPKTSVTVNVDGINGNAFAVIGAVRRALREAHVEPAVIAAYTHEAMAGNYENLLVVTLEYVDVQ